MSLKYEPSSAEAYEEGLGGAVQGMLDSTHKIPDKSQVPLTGHWVGERLCHEQMLAREESRLKGHNLAATV